MAGQEALTQLHRYTQVATDPSASSLDNVVRPLFSPLAVPTGEQDFCDQTVSPRLKDNICAFDWECLPPSMLVEACVSRPKSLFPGRPFLITEVVPHTQTVSKAGTCNVPPAFCKSLDKSMQYRYQQVPLSSWSKSASCSKLPLIISLNVYISYQEAYRLLWCK